MPIPFVLPAFVALVGAVLSDELSDEEDELSDEEDEPPEWDIDVGDRDFHAADDREWLGKLYVDLLGRKILGIVLRSNQSPSGRWDFSMVVGKVSGRDVRAWVEGNLGSIEEAREDFVDAGEMTYQDRWWEDLKSEFQRKVYDTIRIVQTPREAIDQLSSDLGRDRILRLVLKDGVNLFDDLDGVEIDGDQDDRVEAISGWAASWLEREAEVSHTASLPEEGLELLSLLGEPHRGFDVIFFDDSDPDEIDHLAGKWGLFKAELPDGSAAWRFLVKDR